MSPKVTAILPDLVLAACLCLAGSVQAYRNRLLTDPPPSAA